MRREDNWPSLLTTAQASDYLRLRSGVQRSYCTLCNLRSRGGGPTFVRVGRSQVRYRQEDLEQWAQTIVRDCHTTLSV